MKTITDLEWFKLKNLMVNANFKQDQLFIRGSRHSRSFKVHNLYVALCRELEEQERDDKVSRDCLDRIFYKLETEGDFTHFDETGKVTVI